MSQPDERWRDGGSALPPHLDPRGGSRPPRRGPETDALPPHLDPRDGARAPSPDPRDGALPPHLDPRGPGSRRLPPGPAVRPSRRRRGARVLSWVALVLSVLVFAVATLGYVLYRRYDGNINRIPGLNQALPGLSKPSAAPKGARNILLVGSDTRDTTGAEFQGGGAAGRVVGQRSDTVILAHLYGGNDQAQLVSFPRDSWVPIPRYTDPKTGRTVPEHSAKLNSAIAEGGPALLIATVEKLTDIRVDNYVSIDFAGFQGMVSKLGGVEICLTHAAKEPKSGIDLPAGRQVVDGAQALAFVRQRYDLPGGDLDRIHRQQAFIASITRKVLSSGTLLDPFKLNGFLSAATSSVSVDDSLSGSGLAQLALRLRSFNAGGVTFSTLPVADPGGRRAGQSVVLLDDARAAQVFDALRQDRLPGEPTGPAVPGGPGDTPLTVAPRGVRVAVLNGAGTAGLGRTVAQELTRGGFSVVGEPGNDGNGQTGTVVRYGPAGAEAARTLAAAVRGGATLQQDATLSGSVQLVVGSDWKGLTPVTVGAAGTAGAPTAPAAPAGAPVSAAQDGCVA